MPIDWTHLDAPLWELFPGAIAIVRRGRQRLESPKERLKALLEGKAFDEIVHLVRTKPEFDAAYQELIAEIRAKAKAKDNAEGAEGSGESSAETKC